MLTRIAPRTAVVCKNVFVGKKSSTGSFRFFAKSSGFKKNALKREAAELRKRVVELEEELEFFQRLMIESQQQEDDFLPVGHPIYNEVRRGVRS